MVLCFSKVYFHFQIQEYSHRVANVFKAHGYRKGQAVGLLASNCPQYPAVWLGLSRLGVITPLINNNLRTKALLHSITVGLCDAIIYSEEYEQGSMVTNIFIFADIYVFTVRKYFVLAIKDIAKELSPSISLYRWSPSGNKANHISGVDGTVKDLTSLLESASNAPIAHPPDRTFHDKLLYIYTSGTTGLPKAAVITHSRYVFLTLFCSSY